MPGIWHEGCVSMCSWRAEGALSSNFTQLTRVPTIIYWSIYIVCSVQVASLSFECISLIPSCCHRLSHLWSFAADPVCVRFQAAGIRRRSPAPKTRWAPSCCSTRVIPFLLMGFQAEHLPPHFCRSSGWQPDGASFLERCYHESATVRRRYAAVLLRCGSGLGLESAQVAVFDFPELHTQDPGREYPNDLFWHVEGAQRTYIGVACLKHVIKRFPPPFHWNPWHQFAPSLLSAIARAPVSLSWQISFPSLTHPPYSICPSKWLVFIVVVSLGLSISWIAMQQAWAGLTHYAEILIHTYHRNAVVLQLACGGYGPVQH